jgi:hypothetical protein
MRASGWLEKLNMILLNNEFILRVCVWMQWKVMLLSLGEMCGNDRY